MESFHRFSIFFFIKHVNSSTNKASLSYIFTDHFNTILQYYIV